MTEQALSHDTEMAEWAQHELLLEQEYDRYHALVHCHNLAETDSKKSIRTAAKIIVAQLERASNEVRNVRH